ncbi:hypothetical protein EI534_07740 [Pseudomonas frederiksbergensis]|nr:hypothetical protein [Pseudomonas frederiksbergensis]
MDSKSKDELFLTDEDLGKIETEGLKVVIPPYQAMELGDTVTVYWSGVGPSEKLQKIEPKVSAFIVRADALTLTDEVPIDGHVTVEMRYL